VLIGAIVLVVVVLDREVVRDVLVVGTGVEDVVVEVFVVEEVLLLATELLDDVVEDVALEDEEDGLAVVVILAEELLGIGTVVVVELLRLEELEVDLLVVDVVVEDTI